MTDSIDAQVAAFAREIDDTAVLDVAQISSDVAGLGRRILAAETHDLAAVEFLERPLIVQQTRCSAPRTWPRYSGSR